MHYFVWLSPLQLYWCCIIIFDFVARIHICQNSNPNLLQFLIWFCFNDCFWNIDWKLQWHNHELELICNKCICKDFISKFMTLKTFYNEVYSYTSFCVQYRNLVVWTFLSDPKSLIDQQWQIVLLHHSWGSGRHCKPHKRSSRSTVPKRFGLFAISSLLEWLFLKLLIPNFQLQT